MRRVKKLSDVLLISTCLPVLMCLLTVGAFAASATSGKCGDSARWSFNATTKTLTISGTGAMYDYDHWYGKEGDAAPWYQEDFSEQIESVVIGSNITYVGNEAFCYGYPNLRSVTFDGNKVTEIGYEAFYGAEAMNSITLPASLKTIGYHALPTSLEKITVSAGTSQFYTVDDVLYQGTTLVAYPTNKSGSSYTIISGTTGIAIGALDRSTNLTSITVPGSVQSVPHLALPYYLTSITLEEGIESIDSSAFCYCPYLTEATIPASVTNFTSEITGDCDHGGTFSIYFKGDAPAMDTAFVDGVYWYGGGKAIVYYPANASGWEAVQQQSDIAARVKSGELEFRTWDGITGVSVRYAATSGGDETFTGLKYSDSWFFQDAAEYDHALARMSIGLAMSGFPSNENAEKDANVRQLYDTLGFDKNTYYSVGYDSEDNDTVAMAIDTKTITATDGASCTLLAICLRGGGYGSGGWVGNFNVGNSGVYHVGFNKAANYARGVVSRYIKEKGLSTASLRIWLTGYSRSAATANLLSNKLKLDGLVKDGNIFTYTFATPNNQTTKIVVSNTGTFNLIRPSDIVPQVPLSAWGFGKMGTSYLLAEPNEATSIKAAEAWLINAASKALPTRDMYHAYLEPALMAYFAGDKTAFDVFFMGYTTLEEIVEVVDSEVIEAYIMLAGELMLAISKTDDAPVKSLLSDFVALLKGAASELLDSSKGNNNLKVLDMLVDVYERTTNSAIAQRHHPEAYLFSMMNYDEAQLTKTDQFLRKTVIVSCPVDVRVYRTKTDTLVAKIVDDCVVYVMEGIEAAVLGESDKVLVLPSEEDYYLKLEATNEGTMDYTVLESAADGTVTRTVEFYDVPLSAGKAFTAEVDQEADTPKANYALKIEDDETVIMPDYDSNDVQVDTSAGTVRVRLNDTSVHTVVAAVYDEQGKQLACAVSNAAENSAAVTLTLSYLTDGAYLRVFYLNKDGQPICEMAERSL